MTVHTLVIKVFSSGHPPHHLTRELDQYLPRVLRSWSSYKIKQDVMELIVDVHAKQSQGYVLVGKFLKRCWCRKVRFLLEGWLGGLQKNVFTAELDSELSFSQAFPRLNFQADNPPPAFFSCPSPLLRLPFPPIPHILALIFPIRNKTKDTLATTKKNTLIFLFFFRNKPCKSPKERP